MSDEPYTGPFRSARAHRKWGRQRAREQVPASWWTRVRATYSIRHGAAATRLSNWRNRRTIERGRRPRTTQAADAARSSLPVYRDRINPATGRPHRDDRQLGRTTDRELARMAPVRRADRAAVPQDRAARGRTR